MCMPVPSVVPLVLGTYWEDSSGVYWENKEYTAFTTYCDGYGETRINLPQCCRPCNAFSGQVRGRGGVSCFRRVFLPINNLAWVSPPSHGIHIACIHLKSPPTWPPSTHPLYPSIRVSLTRTNTW